MSDQETFDALARLLSLYPRVGYAIACRADNGSVWIKFRCGSMSSLKSIAKCAEWANQRLVVGALGHFNDEPADCIEPYFEVSIPDDADTQSPSWCQIFGINLARQLKAKGLLAPDEAHELQERWNAVAM